MALCVVITLLKSDRMSTNLNQIYRGESMKLASVLFSLIAISAMANADTLQLGNPAYGGTATSASSALPRTCLLHRTICPSACFLSDSYVAQAGNGVAFDRKNCNIAVPHSRPPRPQRIGVCRSTIGASPVWPAGGRASLSVDYFLATGGRGLHTSKSFVGPISSDYLKSDDIGVQAVVWTACGADTILRANTSMLVQSGLVQPIQADGDGRQRGYLRTGLIYRAIKRRCLVIPIEMLGGKHLSPFFLFLFLLFVSFISNLWRKS